MSNSNISKNKEEYIREINIFKQERTKYVLLSQVLLQILHKIVKKVGAAIVQTRAKDIVSFAEKIQRPGKKHKYSNNPIDDLTDLCGGRCIFPTLEGVEKCSKLIEKEFRVYWEESEDKLSELGVSQFGYLSKHYIIQLNLKSPIVEGLTFQKKTSSLGADSKDKIIFSNFKVIERDYDGEGKIYNGNDVSRDMRRELFEELQDLYSEIQVRTLLQHAWGEIAHDRVYKANFPIPKTIQRSFNRVSAVLENTDAGFQKMIEELDMYVKNYGAYMTNQEIKEEIERLKIVVEIAPDLSKVEQYVYRITSLARSIEKWEETINILDWYSQKVILSSRLNREYGLALSKSTTNPNSNQYLRAKKYLRLAIEENPEDSDAYSIFGGWWKKKGNLDKALNYYEKAYNCDPDDSYAVGNYFILEISHNKNYKILQYSKPIFQNVIAKCEMQKEIGVNIPWVFFDLGLFHLFLGNIMESLLNYLTGIRYCNSKWMIGTTLNTIDLLYEFEDKILGLKLVKHLLLLGLAYRFNEHSAIRAIEEIQKGQISRMKPPIVILAGKISQIQGKSMKEIEEILSNTFQHKSFTLLSRGIDEKGYKAIKSTGNASGKILKELNLELSPKKQDNFNQLEKSARQLENVLKYWSELLLNNIEIEDLKLIGIGADPLTSFEYRTALVFGCQVGVCRDLSNINSQLFEDKDYFPSKIYNEEELKKISEKEKLKVESHPIRLFNLSMDKKSLLKFLDFPYHNSPV